MPTISHGNEETTQTIDDNGSTKTIVKRWENEALQKPVRHRYEIRHRTDKTNITAIEQLIKSLLADPAKLDASVKIERTKMGEQKGYYNLVECYTTLEF